MRLTWQTQKIQLFQVDAPIDAPQKKELCYVGKSADQVAGHVLTQRVDDLSAKAMIPHLPRYSASGRISQP